MSKLTQDPKAMLQEAKKNLQEDIGTKDPKSYGTATLGAAAISIVKDPRIPEFILNAKKDGWFRRTEGQSKGLGLALTHFKVTSEDRKFNDPTQNTSPYKRYNVSLKWTNPNDENKEDKGAGWLYVHKDHALYEVSTHIQTNMSKWRP